MLPYPVAVHALLLLMPCCSSRRAAAYALPRCCLCPAAVLALLLCWP